jgi:hypothetical protein
MIVQFLYYSRKGTTQNQYHRKNLTQVGSTVKEMSPKQKFLTSLQPENKINGPARELFKRNDCIFAEIFYTDENFKHIHFGMYYANVGFVRIVEEIQ